MLRAAVLFLVLLAARPAAAQLSIADLKSDLKKLDGIWLTQYDRAMSQRDVFASIHDSIRHGAYVDLNAARAKYLSAKKQIEASIAAGEASKATRELSVVEAAGEELGEKLSLYLNSSKDAVEKIQIGLGVFAFLIAGGVFLIFKRKKSAASGPR